MTSKVLARVASLVWFVLASGLLLLTLLMAIMVTPASLIFAAIFAVMGIAALIVAALLIVMPARRWLFVISIVLGSLFTIIGGVTYLRSEEGVLLTAEPILAFATLSLVATLASGVGAQAPRDRTHGA